jgi:hypothetical protein
LLSVAQLDISINQIKFNKGLYMLVCERHIMSHDINWRF